MGSKYPKRKPNITRYDIEHPSHFLMQYYKPRSPQPTNPSHQTVEKDGHIQNHSPSSRLLHTTQYTSTSRQRTHSFTTYPQLEVKNGESSNAENRELSSAETLIPLYHDWKHDLRGLGAQFEGNHYVSNTSSQQIDSFHTTPCPYHQALLEEYLGPGAPQNEADVLSSYLDGVCAQQYALYYREDTESLSTRRNCNCSSKVYTPTPIIKGYNLLAGLEIDVESDGLSGNQSQYRAIGIKDGCREYSSKEGA